MPTQHGNRFENEERLLPVLETAGEKQQCETVETGETWFSDLALEDDELLTEQSIFEQQFRLGTSQIESEGECGRGLGQLSPVEVAVWRRRGWVWEVTPVEPGKYCHAILLTCPVSVKLTRIDFSASTVLLESVVTDANNLVPPREWLVSHMAARVHPPGEAAGYSNYNAMLAGYIVARASGQPYDQYIQDHIFTPLGMAHSTAQSVTPPDLRKYASTGYTYRDSALRVYPEYMAQPALMPSGGQQASVNDMARFMIAHLQGGSYRDATIGEARILNETTAKQMQSTLYTPDPRLGGTAYGFFDLSDNGEQTLGSEGYFPPMHSQLLLLPAQNLGVFVTYNSSGADGLTVQHIGFQSAFFDHYYPASQVEPIKPAPNTAQQVSRFVGIYRYASSPATTLIKVIELFGGYLLEISDPGDGTVLLNLSGIKFRFVQVEPLYFRQVDGPFQMIFREDGNGRITQMYTDFMPQYTSVKLDWYETPGFGMALVLVCLLAFLSLIPVVLIRAIRSRRHSENGQPATRSTFVAQSILLAICVLNLLFVVGVMLWGQPPTELGDISLMAKVVLGHGVLSAVLTVGALVYAVLAWKNSYWGIAGRVYYTLVTGAAVAFVWFLNYWNMLGWRL